MAEPSFFEKYRGLIIGGVGVIGLLIIGYFFFFGNNNHVSGNVVATGPKYACDSLLTPGPSDTLPPSLPLPAQGASYCSVRPIQLSGHRKGTTCG